MFIACRQTFLKTYKNDNTFLSTNNDADFIIEIHNEKKIIVFFHAWIDKRFEKKGEICLYIGKDKPKLRNHFNATIYIDNNNFVVNNFGFFRSNEKIELNLLTESSIFSLVFDEIQKWSENKND